MTDRHLTGTAQQALRRASNNPWLHRLARLGFVAKGLVYIVIGYLAASLIFLGHGDITDRAGVIRRMKSAPLGDTLLVIVAAGLTGYAVWRLIQGIADTDHKGTGWKAILERIGFFSTGVAHFALAIFAFRIAAGEAVRSGNEPRKYASLALKLPFGELLILLAGLIALGVAVYLFISAAQGKFHEQLSGGSMGTHQHKWAIRLGTVGIAAQGYILALIGVFLLTAAYRSDPRQVRDLDGALADLLNKPFGSWILAATALGLIAHGLYAFIEARYRRV